VEEALMAAASAALAAAASVAVALVASGKLFFNIHSRCA